MLAINEHCMPRSVLNVITYRSKVEEVVSLWKRGVCIVKVFTNVGMSAIVVSRCVRHRSMIK